MKKIKDKKGFTGIDISIAIVIVIITIGIAVAMIGRISNQVREIEVDTIVSGKLGQEINEIQKRKAQGENLSGNVKTLTIENQVYDLYVNGDKVLIKRTVRGQQIDYREVDIQKRNAINDSDSDGTELGRLSKLVDMYDYEYQDIKMKLNLVLVESYYEVNAQGRRELKFRKKTQDLLKKDQLFGKDLGVFLATHEHNVSADGKVIDKRQVRMWVNKLARKAFQNDNTYPYQQYFMQKLNGQDISPSEKNNLPDLDGVFKEIEYDKNSNKKYVNKDKNTRSEVTNTDISEYSDVYYQSGGLNDDQMMNPKGFWFKLEDPTAGDYGMFMFRKSIIAEFLAKNILARVPYLKEEIIQNRIEISRAFRTIENNYIEQ